MLPPEMQGTSIHNTLPKPVTSDKLSLYIHCLRNPAPLIPRVILSATTAPAFTMPILPIPSYPSLPSLCRGSSRYPLPSNGSSHYPLPSHGSSRYPFPPTALPVIPFPPTALPIIPFPPTALPIIPFPPAALPVIPFPPTALLVIPFPPAALPIIRFPPTALPIIPFTSAALPVIPFFYLLQTLTIGILRAELLPSERPLGGKFMEDSIPPPSLGSACQWDEIVSLTLVVTSSLLLVDGNLYNSAGEKHWGHRVLG